MDRKNRQQASPLRPRSGPSGRPSPLGETTTEDGGQLTDFGCPDCPGVLAFRRMGRELSFTCTVGHSFSAESLLEAKEEELEAALWGGIELYMELAAIHRELARQARADGAEADARGREERAAKAEEFVERLRQVIASDGMASQQDGT